MYSHDSFKKKVQKGMTGKTLVNCSIKNRNMTFIFVFCINFSEGTFHGTTPHQRCRKETLLPLSTALCDTYFCFSFG